MQFQYSYYDGMGVPITWEILNSSQWPSNDDLFPYFYDGTTENEYKRALAVESTGLLCDKDLICTIKRYWKKNDMCLDLFCSNNSYITWICIINEFIYKEQGTNDDGHMFPKFWWFQRIMWFWIPPQKQKTMFQFETPDTSHQSMSQFKDTFLFLSPATQKFHDSIEKATKMSEIVYDTQTLKEVWKYIIDSIDHIINHNLVCQHPAAAKFVAVIERKMQEIKEEFNKEVLSILGLNIGEDNE